jgi:hypothetical protein
MLVIDVEYNTIFTLSDVKSNSFKFTIQKSNQGMKRSILDWKQTLKDGKTSKQLPPN